MKKTFILLLLSFLCFTVSAEEPSMNISRREEISVNDSAYSHTAKPEKSSSLPSRNTKVYIRTNVSGAKVFLNGIYQGTSNITISDLREGLYNLKIEKDGYRTEHLKIQVSAGKQNDYYVELKQWTGLVTFSVQPSKATIKVDSDTVYHSTVELSEGRHTVTARLFGYETLEDEIWIERHRHIYADIVLTPAAFKVSDFKAAKASFNPGLPSSMGKCNFDFYVTNNGSCSIQIADEAGSVVRNARYDEFSTWKQAFAWDGRNESGFIVPDGVYTATLTSGETVLQAGVTVDSSIQYSMAFPGPEGLSVGGMGTALMNPADTLALYTYGGIDFTNKTDVFYGAPFAAGFDYAIYSWLSAGAYCGWFPKRGPDTFIAGCSLKLAGKVKTESGALDFAGFIKACGNESDLYEPCGFDNDRGVGLGFAGGYESKSLYAGILSEFIFNSIQDDDLYDMDYMWKNGITVQLRGNRFAAGLYGTMCSVFGEKNYWNRSAECGLDITVQPGYLPAFINLRSGILYFSDCDNKMYSRTRIGFEYLL